jgi:hypothetical protein
MSYWKSLGLGNRAFTLATPAAVHTAAPAGLCGAFDITVSVLKSCARLP